MQPRLSSLSCLCVLSTTVLVEAQDEAAIRRGRYIFRASGGCSCHRDPANTEFSGGRPIGTPFGTIYGSNITPDRETGIGAWSEEDFVRAMTEGVGPDGKDYYPVFPYTSFTRMKREDLLDLKAYLFSLPAVSKPNQEPELGFPFNLRTSVKACEVEDLRAIAVYLKSLKPIVNEVKAPPKDE